MLAVFFNFFLTRFPKLLFCNNIVKILEKDIKSHNCQCFILYLLRYN